MHVGLLACDEVADQFRQIAGGYQAMFQRLLAPHVPNLQLTRFDLQRGELPASPLACDAWITTGSRASVYDDAAWIRSRETFVREVADTDRPFVGICFGHQVLARTFGADVRRATGGWGAGVYPTRVLHTKSWMEPRAQTIRLQYMHADQVLSIPPDGELLGEAPHCPIAMFTVGERMLGIEAHPEFPASYARALIEYRSSRIGEAASEDALSRVDEPTDSHVVAAWIARFLSISSA